MPVEFRTQRDGSLREHWYGRYEINGKLFRLNLGVKIAGTPPFPLTLRKRGDVDFEVSRALAQAKLDSIAEEAKSKQGAVRLAQKLYEMKTGEKAESVMLADLDQEWLKIPRKQKPRGQYVTECQKGLQAFVAHIQEKHPTLVELGQITRSMARAYMEFRSNGGVSGRTWNGTLKLLRSTFRHLLQPGSLNPFAEMPMRSMNTVFRKPFSPEELKLIMDAAEHDEFIKPMVVVGICTAMRRGDCCLLDWKDVDLKKRFIAVKTAKTEAMVSIPIFELLYEMLKERYSLVAKEGKPEGYVFPEQAKMYEENPDEITLRVKRVIARALAEKGAKPSPLPEDVRRLGHGYITGLAASEKKDRMLKIFDTYMDGKPTQVIAAEMRVSKGTVSGYLKEIAGGAKCQIIRQSDKKSLRTNNLLSVERKDRKRRASVRDFHSLRVTWVTLALTAGVPLELVQKVTGHQTTDIVLKHYFQPGQEDFRNALESAMPELLTKSTQSNALINVRDPGSSNTAKGQFLELIQQVKQSATREQMLKLLEEL